MDPITEAAFVASLGFERASAAFTEEVLAPALGVGGVAVAGVAVPVYHYTHPTQQEHTTDNMAPRSRKRGS